MRLNGGLGLVTQKKQFADSSVETVPPIAAVKHGNGHDWWAVRLGKDYNSDTIGFYLYQITEDSAVKQTPQIFVYPATSCESGYIYSQVSFSNNGKFLAHTNSLNPYIGFGVFDRCSGIVTSHKLINIPKVLPSQHNDTFATGVCFSPNDSLLYVTTTHNVWQLDLYDTDSATAWTVIGGMDTTIADFQRYSTLTLAHDGAMYVGHTGGTTGSLSRIDNPNVKGIGAGWCPKCLDFPGVASVAGGSPCCIVSPPNMPNFNLGADPECITSAGGVGPVKASYDVELFPNPANTTLTIRSRESGTIEILDLWGSKVIVASKGNSDVRLDIAALPSGVYFYQFSPDRSKGAGHRTKGSQGKLVITH
jgi:hypothetical protein